MAFAKAFTFSAPTLILSMMFIASITLVSTANAATHASIQDIVGSPRSASLKAKRAYSQNHQ